MGRHAGRIRGWPARRHVRTTRRSGCDSLSRSGGRKASTWADYGSVVHAHFLPAFGDRLRTVRVYDNAHGVHDMHRYNRAGEKQPAEAFHDGSASEALQSALDAVRDSYREMIESWRR